MKIGEYEIHPKQFMLAATAVVALLGYVEARYAKAGMVGEQLKYQQQTIYEFRAQQLDDEIFKLEFQKQEQGTLSPLEDAILKRYQRQLQDLKQKGVNIK